jgi:uncharacterized membrane protein
MRYADYVNVFLFAAIVFLFDGMFVLFAGYSYSTAFGMSAVSHPTERCVLMCSLSILMIAMDILYVHLKRRYKKKGFYKDEA